MPHFEFASTSRTCPDHDGLTLGCACLFLGLHHTMSSITPQVQKRPHPEEDGTARKRFKTSELPLSVTTRSAIDGLVVTFQKKGEFDRLRKQVWAKFESSVSRVDSLSHRHEYSCNRRHRKQSLPLPILSPSSPSPRLIEIPRCFHGNEGKLPP